MSTGIRSLAHIVAKYGRVTPGKAREFEEGVRSPKQDWQTETLDATDAWENGVTAAIARGSFAAGVDRVGTAHWQDMSVRKGAGRFRQGVEIGIPLYQRNFAPFRDVIAGTDLPPRRPVGDPANLDRVRVIAEALHSERIRRQAGR